MNLLNIYKEKNNNVVWKDKFFSSGKGKGGKVFSYTNTNYRTLSAYRTNFPKFEQIENENRGAWYVSEHHGQETHKQHVIPMLEAQLFKKIKSSAGLHNFLYTKTLKGDSYKKFIKNDFLNEEIWLINYLYLLNGTYGSIPNHIIRKTEEILTTLGILNINKKSFIEKFNLAIKTKKYAELLKNDLFYVMSFYSDVEFLEVYFHATDQEKNELHLYILKNLRETNDNCCISYKCKPGGTYSYQTAIDELKVFYFTQVLLEFKAPNIEIFLSSFLSKYKEYFSDIRNKIVLDYLNQENEIIDSILFDVFEFSDEEIEIEDSAIEEHIKVEEDAPAPFIDTTAKEGKRQANKIFNQKKKYARSASDYKCSLENYRECDKHYFTSKKSKKNYIEIHHLIPREFSNRFEKSIEIYANYVVLCPSCHQLLHKAVDRERKGLLLKLLKERNDKLNVMGLEIESKDLLDFYGIEN